MGHRGEDGQSEERHLFLSYHSADSDLARPLAEHLTAAGADVWFLEYALHPRRPEQWTGRIEDGIRTADGAIVIAGPAYAASASCRRELAELVDRFGPPEVLVAQSPASPDLPPELAQLTKGCRVVDGADPPDVVAGVSRALRVTVPPSAAAGPPHRIRGACFDVVYSIDVAGWDVISSGGRAPSGVHRGPQVRLGAPGAPLTCTVTAHSDISRPEVHATGDALAIHRELCRMAPAHLHGDDGDPAGVHLTWRDGIGQLAVSFRLPGHWCRTYSILVGRPAGRIIEFIFHCSTGAPFGAFLSGGWAMDRLVASLRIQPALGGDSTAFAVDLAPFERRPEPSRGMT